MKSKLAILGIILLAASPLLINWISYLFPERPSEPSQYEVGYEDGYAAALDYAKEVVHDKLSNEDPHFADQLTDW